MAALAVLGSASAQHVNCSSLAPPLASMGVTLLNGTATTLGSLTGRATLVVNVASF